MREYVRPDLADAVRRIKLRMQAEHARTIRELDQLLCEHGWVSSGLVEGHTACAWCGADNYSVSEQHHNGHYGVLAMHAFGPRNADGLCGAIVQYPVNGEVRNVPCGAEPHHESHYDAVCPRPAAHMPAEYSGEWPPPPAGPVCVCLVQGAGRAFCPIHAADQPVTGV